MDRHPSYEKIKQRGPSPLYPLSTALLRYWEHMENEHNSNPDEYGYNVLGWHTKNHPECTSLPTYEEASKC